MVSSTQSRRVVNEQGVAGQSTAIFAGALLLASAALRSRQYALVPTGLRAHWSIPGLEPLLIASEIFLGLWLISGTLPRASRRAAVGCFSAFACYTLCRALAGKADCGCFGQVHVNPWLTFALDVCVALALLALAKPFAKYAIPPNRWAARRWPLAAAAAIGLVAGFGVAALHPKVLPAANGLATVGASKLVILEPHGWLGRRMPLLSHIVSEGGRRPLGRTLSAGAWIVMFYHASCGECQEAIPAYEGLARRMAMAGKKPHVAFIRVPSDPPNPVPPGLFDSHLPLYGALDASHQWFATTPIAVQLRGGRVVGIAFGRAAMSLHWIFQGGVAG